MIDLRSEQILISTQGPNRHPFTLEIKYLFTTLNRYGGKLADAQKIACFSEPVDSKTANELEKLGVKIMIVNDIDKRCPHASKIQNLSLFQDENFEFLIALDTDVLIINDFSEFIDQSKISAKPVDNDPLSIDDWKNLFGYFGLEVPKERYMTHFTMQETIPYFNSGVLLIPKKFIKILYETWKKYVLRLLSSYEDLPKIKKHSFFTDQFALSLALKDAGMPHNALPLEMNFPTHMDVHKDCNPNKINPYLLHYHHLTPSNTIAHCSYENINKIIDQLNIDIRNF